MRDAAKAHEGKTAAELQRELARPVPGFRAMMVAFVVNVARLEHPPGDVRKCVGARAVLLCFA